MCLAIPMRVLATQTTADDSTVPREAVVDADGIRKTVRLDLADRIPRPGDYVIVHAGFVIRTLSESEARANLALMRQMAEGLETGPEGSGP